MHIYREKHFLKNRDLKAYKLKQAGSCLYLERLFDGYIERYKEGEIVDVYDYLRRIHREQYKRLNVGCNCPEHSFYFEHMFDNVIDSEEKLKRLGIHYLSYLRGLQRYESLINHFFVRGERLSELRIWDDLFQDAKWNSEYCYRLLGKHLDYDLKEIIDVEAKLMKKIDRKQYERLKAKYGE